MKIEEDSLWRGCTASFPLDVDNAEKIVVKYLVEIVYRFNCRIAAAPLDGIKYRGRSVSDPDISKHVFRWDKTPYHQIFKYGFRARSLPSTFPDKEYFNLDHHVHEGGVPGGSSRDIPIPHFFVSTSWDSHWNPKPEPGEEYEIYRYEIYAPGGISVLNTLGENRYKYKGQKEVAFVANIATEYIRSAQKFRLATTKRGMTRRSRVNTELILNRNFKKQQGAHRPRYPIKSYMLGRKSLPLETRTWPDDADP